MEKFLLDFLSMQGLLCKLQLGRRLLFDFDLSTVLGILFLSLTWNLKPRS